jgi:hypothetical protein
VNKIGRPVHKTTEQNTELQQSGFPNVENTKNYVYIIGVDEMIQYQ